jgi:hypothetical protein
VGVISFIARNLKFESVWLDSIKFNIACRGSVYKIVLAKSLDV